MPFGFRLRGEERDDQADSLRLSRLLATLDDVEAGLLSEKSGLQQRYESATVHAAFAQQYFEDEVQDPALSQRIDDLTRSIKGYARRMEALERQIGLIERLRASTTAFAEDCGLGRAVAPPARQRH